MQTKSVLIIDDHPLISSAYKKAFGHISAQDATLQFEVTIVGNCDDAMDSIKKASEQNGIDIIFLDISLPPSADRQILSGEDLGLKINLLLPKSKVIISTTFNDNYRVHTILNTINPDGFLVKNDISPEELIEAIKRVLVAPPYYSTTVLNMLRKQFTANYQIDKIDRQLLYELSKGTKMKELPTVIPMSMAGIEKRKRHLMEVFNVADKSDKQMIEIAKEKGFI